METWKVDLLKKQIGSTRKYRCSWGLCNSDARYYTKREDMKDVFFLAFPAKVRHKEKCLQWIKACNRPNSQLNIETLRDYDYICSKHFVGGNGPTEEKKPDPLTAETHSVRGTGRKKNRQKPGCVDNSTLTPLSFSGQASLSFAQHFFIKTQLSIFDNFEFSKFIINYDDHHSFTVGPANPTTNSTCTNAYAFQN